MFIIDFSIRNLLSEFHLHHSKIQGLQNLIP